MHGVHNPGAVSSKENSRAPHPADSAAVKAYDQLNKLWMKFIMNQDATNDYGAVALQSVEFFEPPRLTGLPACCSKAHLADDVGYEDVPAFQPRGAR